MKKSKDKLTTSYEDDERLGIALSRRLRQEQPEECPGPEELAALIDGHLDEEQKDQHMRHISACDRCYEAFILGSQMHKETVKRKNIVFNPLALAASVLIVILSIYIVYKSGLTPKKSEPEYPAAEAVVEHRKAPAPAMKKTFGTDVNKEKAAISPAEKLQPPRKRDSGKGAGRKDEFEDEKVPPGHFEAKKSHSQVYPSKAMKVERFQKEETEDAEAVTVRKKEESPRTGRGETVTRLKSADREVAKRNQKPSKAVPSTVSGVTVEESVGQDRRQEFGASDEKTTWNEVDRLNQQQFNYKEYIPPKEQKLLFNEAINLTNKLEGELMEFRQQAQKSRESRQIQTYQRRAGPFLNIVVVQDGHTISPNINYFQQRSKPGSVEYQFYALARLGWYYKGNWYDGGEDVTQTVRSIQTLGKTGIADKDDTREGSIGDKSSIKKLLKRWEKLQPYLKGIFREIADQTIEHLTGCAQ